jgi:hypothetical protein
MMWHGPAGRCIDVVCKHSDGLGGPYIYIYMSIHVFWIQNVFYICFWLMFYDDIYSICCDRMYDYVYVCVA